VWLILIPPHPIENTSTQNIKIILECDEGSVIFICCVFGYDILLALTAFVFAFIARKLEDYFRWVSEEINRGAFAIDIMAATKGEINIHISAIQLYIRVCKSVLKLILDLIFVQRKRCQNIILLRGIILNTSSSSSQTNTNTLVLICKKSKDVCYILLL